MPQVRSSVPVTPAAALHVVVADVEDAGRRVEQVGDDADAVLADRDVVAGPGHGAGAEEVLQLQAGLAADHVDDGVVGDVGVGVGEQDDPETAVHRVAAEVADHVAGDQVAGRDGRVVGEFDAALGHVLDDVVFDDQVVDIEEVVVGVTVLDAATSIDVDRADLDGTGAERGVVAVDDQPVDGDVVGQDADEVVGVGVAAGRVHDRGGQDRLHGGVGLGSIHPRGEGGEAGVGVLAVPGRLPG